MPSLTSHERKLVSQYLRKHSPTRLPDYYPTVTRLCYPTLQKHLSLPMHMTSVSTPTSIPRDISLKD